MAYKYKNTIKGGAEKLIDGIENIEMFLDEEDHWNFHDSEIESFGWDVKTQTFTVTVNLIGCRFPESLGIIDKTKDVLLDLHFVGFPTLTMNQVELNSWQYITEIEITNVRKFLECWFNGYAIKVASERLIVDKPRVVDTRHSEE